ncbi:VOC family protein [Candidatus Dependentiae bacterium]|nr:VOC family protein [Candidatus Dependentiae bacterium]MCC7414901.1 VOC family protein [Campylobacterota bacterium]
MQTVSNVAMIILMQQDIAKGVAFYQKLGLKLLFHLRDKWAELDLGGVKIGLCPTSVDPIDRRIGVVFAVEDLQAFYQEHKDSGMFMNEPTEALHGIMVSFKDPGGNILDLYQPTPQRVKDLVKRVADEGCCKGPQEADEGSDAGCCRKDKPTC